jgi:hypothetical protein
MNAIAEKNTAPGSFSSRPVEMREPLTCDTEKGTLNTGRMNIWIRNIGNAQASNVFIAPGLMKLVPDHKIGDELADSIPTFKPKDCESKPNPQSQMFPLAAGQEVGLDISQSTGAFRPPFGRGASVQLYMPVCVYYSDLYGNHGTCSVYRLFFPNRQASFVCGTPIRGTFEETLWSSCQN